MKNNEEMNLQEWIFTNFCIKTYFSQKICTFCLDKTSNYLYFFKRGRQTKIKPLYLLVNILAWETSGEDKEAYICLNCFVGSSRSFREEIFFVFQDEKNSKCLICDQKDNYFLFFQNKGICYDCFCSALEEQTKKNLNIYITKNNAMNISKDDMKKVWEILEFEVFNNKQVNELYDEYLKYLFEYNIYILDEAWAEDEEGVKKLVEANQKINELGIKTEIKTNEELEKLFPQIFK